MSSHYLHEWLNIYYQTGATFTLQNGSSGLKNLDLTKYLQTKFPLPPLEIQQQIVIGCETVDTEVAEAQSNIDMARQNISKIVNAVDFTLQKLGTVAHKVSETIDPQVQQGLAFYVGLENVEGYTGRLVGETNTLYQDIKSTKVCFQAGDVLYGKLRPKLNKVYLAQKAGICSTDILVFRFISVEQAKFYAHYFLSEAFNSEVLKTVSGQQLPRTSWAHIQEIKIPVPPLAAQKRIVAKVEALEKNIGAAQAIIASAPSRKQGIIRKYL